MSVQYPHDYHPLAPIVRQLRGTLQWLEQSGVSLDAQTLEPLLQRMTTLDQSKRPKKEHTVLRSRYWSTLSYLPQATDHPKTVDPKTVDPKTVDHETLEIAVERQNNGPLTVNEFPAVTHQRAVVESISFDQPPPSGIDIDGSAELMKPSASLRSHRGINLDQLDQEPLSDISQVTENAFLTDKDAEKSTLNLNASVKKPQRNQLWATAEEAQPLEPSLDPQDRKARSDAFERLKATQIKKRSGNFVHTDESGSEAVNPEDKSSIMRLTSGMPHSRTVRPIGFEEDERFGTLCDSIWGCELCPRKEAAHIVGSGHYGARVMFVVGQPTEHDLTTGQLLMSRRERELFNGLLKAMSLSRLEIYLTSLLKCGADEPKPHEWSACQSHFLNELQLVRPQVVVALGYVPSVILLGPEVRQGAWGGFQEIEVMPTFHPADIVNGGDTLKRQFWRHLRDVMRKVGLNP